jgi:hypothetical protein
LLPLTPKLSDGGPMYITIDISIPFLIVNLLA